MYTCILYSVRCIQPDSPIIVVQQLPLQTVKFMNIYTNIVYPACNNLITVKKNQNIEHQPGGVKKKSNILKVISGCSKKRDLQHSPDPTLTIC